MDPSPEGLGYALDLASGFHHSMANRSIGIHSIPMDKDRPRNTVGDRLGFLTVCCNGI